MRSVLRDGFGSKKNAKIDGNTLKLEKTGIQYLLEFFKRNINIRRIKRGNKQEIETLINEEAMLLGKYLRDERKEWIPRT